MGTQEIFSVRENNSQLSDAIHTRMTIYLRWGVARRRRLKSIVYTEILLKPIPLLLKDHLVLPVKGERERERV